jgi:hypothetical protein
MLVSDLSLVFVLALGVVAAVGAII